MRIDLYLKLIGIFRTRSMAGKACRAGCVIMDGRKLKSSHSVSVGEVYQVVRPDGSGIMIEVLEVPSSKQVSRKERGDYHRIVGMEG